MKSTTTAFVAILGFMIMSIGLGKPQTNDSGTRHSFHKVGSTKIHTFRASRTEFLLTAEETEGRFSIVDETFYPGMDSSPGHTHLFHREVLYVISGSMEWTVGGETETLGPGDLVYIPPNTVHYTKVVGDQAVHALMIFEPGGYERGYMARSELTDEQRRDPTLMQEVSQIMDVEPVRPPTDR